MLQADSSSHMPKGQLLTPEAQLEQHIATEPLAEPAYISFKTLM
jgi:hypothetical protein